MSIIGNMLHLYAYKLSKSLSEEHKMSDEQQVDDNTSVINTVSVQENQEIPAGTIEIPIASNFTVPNAPGLRDNKGKLEYSMLDLTKMQECVKVLMFGKEKYARDNWKLGLKTSEILDSLLRHLAAIQSGELIDSESGLSHLGHIQCNALFLGNLGNTQDVQIIPPNKPLQ